MAFVALPCMVRYRLANTDKTHTKFVYTIKNNEDSTAQTDMRQMNHIPQMEHAPGVYGDRIYLEVKTNTSGKDGIDAGTSTFRLPVRVRVTGTNYIENRTLDGLSDFSLADISSGTLTNDQWTQAFSYAIVAGESVKFGYQASLSPNSREYTNLSDDTGS